MNLEIGTEAAQFSEKEYINGFLLQCNHQPMSPSDARYLHVYQVVPKIFKKLGAVRNDRKSPKIGQKMRDRDINVTNRREI